MKLVVFLCLMIVPAVLNAQLGDEDPDMLNKGLARDQKAIDEAVNGWWKESMKGHEQRVSWWRNAKFGMFVHWGIYSLPGGEWKGKKVSGYAEHLMRKEKISRADYLDLAKQFNPLKFNADEWIRTAKNAGMRYFIITAKHHDGFAMYDSKVSDFNIMKQTPFGRDPMMELAEACRKHDVKFGFYYSHAFDWEHPDAPGNDWEYNNPGGDKNLFGGRNWYDVHQELLPKARKYADTKAIPQIKELLQKYHPDILWFDTPHKLPLSENIRILKAIREVDSKVVVNGRLARSSTISFGDYRNTADRPAEFYPVEGDAKIIAWEAIPTTNESYGYHKFDSSHKSSEHFIQLMANAAARGGNLLMNIGPKGDGAIDIKDMEILNAIGKWFSVNEESIRGTTATPLPLQSWGTSTLKENKLYLHVFQWPENGKLVIGGLKSKIKNAYLLADPSKKKLECKQINDHDVMISLPGTQIDPANSVIVLEVEGKIETSPVRLLTNEKLVQRLLAFDATQTGEGFQFGDGKANRYYVTGWNKKDQSLSWDFRVNQPMKFIAKLKYIAVAGDGSQAQVRLNDKILFDTIAIHAQNGPAYIEPGSLSLQPGSYKLSIAPLVIEGTEIMKLLEILLVPVPDTINVSSIETLQEAINKAKPGEVIVLADGIYKTTQQIVVNRNGTEAQPITIAAQSIGGAEITGMGGFSIEGTSSHITIKGFKFTHAADHAKLASGTSFCRWTQNIFETPGKGNYLTVSGSDHQVDYNTFQNKNSVGKFIAIRGYESQIAQRLWIHHNYFFNFPNQGGVNGAEALQFGLSGFSLSSSNSVVEHNLFEQCHGENELISVKASEVTLRYNTIRGCPAQFTLRHGNRCLVYGNYFINTPGIRIYGDDHIIHSNHFKNCSLAINIGNGGAEVADGAPLVSHDRPDRVMIAFNTLVDNARNIIQTGRENGLGSTFITVAYNIIQGGGPAAEIAGPYTDGVWKGNIIYKTEGGEMPSTSYAIIDPMLDKDLSGSYHLKPGSPAINCIKEVYTAIAVDMDGQPRAVPLDAGADEIADLPVVAHILSRDEVGHNAGSALSAQYKK